MQKRNKNNYAKRTSDLYGKYSFGNIYQNYLFSQKGLDDIKINSVLRDLKSSKISLKQLKDAVVMDVGTGRQAYSFYSLGAKAVDHYDISKDHVKRFTNFLNDKEISNITTTNANLCEYTLHKRKYDYVYLSGIVHHFENTAVGLKNCVDAVKMGGKIWLHFYRSGTFYWMLVQMMRELAQFEELRNFFLSSAIIYADGDTSNEITSNLMDDIYVPSINLYPPQDYKEFMELCGFEICAEVNTKPEGELNIFTAYHTSIYVLKRIREVDISKLNTGKLLTPENSVNQLDFNLQQDIEVIKALKLFYYIKGDLKKLENATIKFALLIALHRLNITEEKFIKEPHTYLERIPSSLNKLNSLLLSVKNNLGL